VNFHSPLISLKLNNISPLSDYLDANMDMVFKDSAMIRLVFFHDFLHRYLEEILVAINV